MKIVKRLLIILLVFFLLLIGALVAIPYFFKDELVATVKTEINNSLRAEVDFSEVDLSIFRSFPDLSLELADFSLVGIDTFAGIPLVKAQKMAVSLDLMSIIQADRAVEIQSVFLNEPEIQVVVLPDGTANYDVTYPSDTPNNPESTVDNSGLVVNLNKYEIQKGSLIYDDRSIDTYLNISGLDHRGTGNFTLDVFDLDTETTIESITVEQGDIAYLDKARMSLDAIFNINAAESIYSLKDNELQVNDLTINADGSIQMKEEDIILDLSFNSPENDFRSLWSLIPNAYTADYQDVAIDGEFRLEGLVKGVYNETTYPAFRLQSKVENGQVKYPDLPLGIQNIRAFLDVNSPGSDLNQMVITGTDLGLQVGSDPFAASFIVKTPISDPDVDATMEGVIDLAQWAKAFPMEGIEELTGRIEADVAVNTRLSTIEREAYEDVNMSGKIGLSSLNYRSEGLPPVVIEDAAMTFTPQRVMVENFDAKLGQSDLQASGSIDNILAYISPEKTMTGQLTAHTNAFYVDEWMEEEAPTSSTMAPTASAASEEEIFDRFDFVVKATADKIVYDAYQLDQSVLEGRIRPNRMEIDKFSTNIGDSDLRGSGTILNAFDYTFDEGVLGGQLEMRSDFLDLNQFMEEEEATAATGTSSEEAYGVIPVPPNMDLSMDVNMKQVRYTNMDLNNVTGKVLVQDESVIIEEGNTKLLGGNMAFAGAYDTKDTENPGYRFMYDMQQMDFTKTFAVFNSFEKLAPIGKFINGQFSSNMIMEGTLGEDMMPKLTDINAEGLLETLNGSLANFKPLNAIGTALDIQELKGGSLALDNVKSWFTVKDGTVDVEPFDVTIADLPMTIAGQHGLDQNMNYTINTVIPRSMLGNNVLGNTVNQGVNALIKQAGQLGVNINNAENLNVQIQLTGSLTDPKVGFKLLGTDGESSLVDSAKDEAKELLQEQVDEVKGQVAEQVDEVKDQVTAQANQVVDSLKNTATTAVQNAGQQVGTQIKDQAGAVIDSTKVGDILQGQGQEAVDRIKDDLKDFNPFKRRRQNQDTTKQGGGGRR